MELSQQESGLHPTKGPNLEKHVSVLYYMKEGKQEERKGHKIRSSQEKKNQRMELSSWEQHSQSE